MRSRVVSSLIVPQNVFCSYFPIRLGLDVTMLYYNIILYRKTNIYPRIQPATHTKVTVNDNIFFFYTSCAYIIQKLLYLT